LRFISGDGSTNWSWAPESSVEKHFQEESVELQIPPGNVFIP
jgi:hypothetical protein